MAAGRKQGLADRAGAAAGAAAGGSAAGAAAAGAAATPRRAAHHDYDYGKEWTEGGGSAAARGRGGGPVEPLDVSGNLVFAGNGYVINKTNTNPYQDLDVRGKIIVVAGLPPELAALQAAAGVAGAAPVPRRTGAPGEAAAGRGRGGATAAQPRAAGRRRIRSARPARTTSRRNSTPPRTARWPW